MKTVPKTTRRWCKRCEKPRLFDVRIRPNGHRQSDCRACRRRRGRNRNPTRISYACMMDRCYREGAVNYKYYGERGITVCDRWRGPEGFRRFVEDMGERPPGRTIDRRDPDLGYTPENCRWATPKEQMEHRRRDGSVERVHVTYVRKKKNYDQVKEDNYARFGTPL